MNILECRHCGIRVVPRADGYCPSCQAMIGSGDSKDSDANNAVKQSQTGKQLVLVRGRSNAPGTILFGFTAFIISGMLCLLFLQGEGIGAEWVDRYRLRIVLISSAWSIVGLLTMLSGIGSAVSNRPSLSANEWGLSIAGIGRIDWAAIDEVFLVTDRGLCTLVICMKPQYINHFRNLKSCDHPGIFRYNVKSKEDMEQKLREVAMTFENAREAIRIALPDFIVTPGGVVKHTTETNFFT